jgi:uncharacterized protein YbbK (DUF523 family)
MVVVSACLAGIPCRWDGRPRPCDKVIELVKAGTAIPVCPEQLGGLTTPRPPSEIVGERVLSKDGADVSREFERGARVVLEIASRYDCREAILKSKSPSCGSGRIYDGTFTGKMVAGDGVTALLLKKNGVAVYTEENFH